MKIYYDGFNDGEKQTLDCVKENQTCDRNTECQEEGK